MRFHALHGYVPRSAAVVLIEVLILLAVSAGPKAIPYREKLNLLPILLMARAGIRNYEWIGQFRRNRVRAVPYFALRIVVRPSSSKSSIAQCCICVRSVYGWYCAVSGWIGVAIAPRSFCRCAGKGDLWRFCAGFVPAIAAVVATAAAVVAVEGYAGTIVAWAIAVVLYVKAGRVYECCRIVERVRVTIEALRVAEVVAAVVWVRLEPSAGGVPVFPVLGVAGGAGATGPEAGEAVVGVVLAAGEVGGAVAEGEGLAEVGGGSGGVGDGAAGSDPVAVGEEGHVGGDAVGLDGRGTPVGFAEQLGGLGSRAGLPNGGWLAGRVVGEAGTV